ncbi:MAG: hypothetical protein Q9227_008361 [Pyrenula ochraceoflavens]
MACTATAYLRAGCHVICLAPTYNAVGNFADKLVEQTKHLDKKYHPLQLYTAQNELMAFKRTERKLKIEDDNATEHLQKAAETSQAPHGKPGYGNLMRDKINEMPDVIEKEPISKEDQDRGPRFPGEEYQDSVEGDVPMREVNLTAQLQRICRDYADNNFSGMPEEIAKEFLKTFRKVACHLVSEFRLVVTTCANVFCEVMKNFAENGKSIVLMFDEASMLSDFLVLGIIGHVFPRSKLDAEITNPDLRMMMAYKLKEQLLNVYAACQRSIQQDDFLREFKNAIDRECSKAEDIEKVVRNEYYSTEKMPLAAGLAGPQAKVFNPEILRYIKGENLHEFENFTLAAPDSDTGVIESLELVMKATKKLRSDLTASVPWEWEIMPKLDFSSFEGPDLSSEAPGTQASPYEYVAQDPGPGVKVERLEVNAVDENEDSSAGPVIGIEKPTRLHLHRTDKEISTAFRRRVRKAFPTQETPTPASPPLAAASKSATSKSATSPRQENSKASSPSDADSWKSGNPGAPPSNLWDNEGTPRTTLCGDPIPPPKEIPDYIPEGNWGRFDPLVEGDPTPQSPSVGPAGEIPAKAPARDKEAIFSASKQT